MANPGKIILAAIAGLLNGWGQARSAIADRKLKEQEFEDKKAERQAKMNESSDAMKMFGEYQKLKNSGASPQDLLAYASFGKTGSPLLYQIDPATFVGSNRARATGTFKGATGIPDSAFGIGGGGGGPVVRRRGGGGGGGGVSSGGVLGGAPVKTGGGASLTPTHRFNPATGKIEPLG